MPLGTSACFRTVLALSFVFFMAASAHAQGCAQCRDTLQSTPPSVQAAYRHAIELLGFSGLAIFAGGVYVLRRFK